MIVLPKVVAKRIKSAATVNVFTDQVVSVNPVGMMISALAERVVVGSPVSPVQVVSVKTVRLTLIVLAERVVVGSRVSLVQVVSVNTVRLILIVLAERVVVATNAILASTVLGFRVPSGLIAEIGKPVVTGLARTYTTVVLILPQP